jgi:hypothetical protein
LLVPQKGRIVFSISSILVMMSPSIANSYGMDMNLVSQWRIHGMLLIESSLCVYNSLASAIFIPTKLYNFSFVIKFGLTPSWNRRIISEPPNSKYPNVAIMETDDT